MFHAEAHDPQYKGMQSHLSIRGVEVPQSKTVFAITKKHSSSLSLSKKPLDPMKDLDLTTKSAAHPDFYDILKTYCTDKQQRVPG
jgi:hypothetical protein